MNLYILSLSPTGGTQKVLELLAKAWEPSPAFIDLSDPQTEFLALTLAPSDVCLIGIPSFGGRVPAAALSHLSRIKGNHAAAVLVTASAQAFSPLSLPGSRPFKKYDGVPLKPTAGKNCTQCGLCASKCPQNARKVNPFLLWAAGKGMKKVLLERKQNELFLAAPLTDVSQPNQPQE